MTNTSIAASVTNFLTIVVGVAFLGVTTIGLASPIKAQTTISTSAAR